jgi:membrane protein DedA with SNARE-associated domain
MMSSLSVWSFSSLTSYGIPVLLLVSFVGSLGLPFPITLVIMGAGALARTGLLDWRLAILACLAGSSLADHSEYLLGRLAQGWWKQRVDQGKLWQQALGLIQRQGSWAIFLTRFWLTPLAPLINMIAGSRYPYSSFLIYDLAGELLWVLLYGGLGYIFAVQWEAASQAVSGFSTLSIALAILAFGIYYLVQRRRTQQQT